MNVCGEYHSGQTTLLWQRVHTSGDNLCHTRLHNPPLTNDSTAFGRCPDCGEEIEAYQSLIEFEQADGSTGVFADAIHATKSSVQSDELAYSLSVASALNFG
ncbi:DUF7837 family putative zinc-binding protein [Haloferax marisrubri]